MGVDLKTVNRVAPVALVAILLTACATAGSGSAQTDPYKPVEIAIDVVGLIGAVIAFMVGLRHYRRAEQWKRAEFVSAEMKEFLASAKVSTAMTLIDWAGRSIRLFCLQDPENRDRTYVDRRMQCVALLPHTVIDWSGSSDREADQLGAKKMFTREHSIIRDCFDAFFDGLERFGGNVGSRLVSADELRPYIGYWIGDIAADTTDAWDATWTACVFLYIQTYGYTGVQVLFEKFGHDISIDGAKFRKFLNSVEDPVLADLLKQGVSDAQKARREVLRERPRQN